MRKTKGIIFLIIWFIWDAAKELNALLRHSISTDYYIYSSSGLEDIFFVMTGTVFWLNIAVVYCLFRPRTLGFRLLLAALIASSLQNLIAVSLALNNIPGVRAAYERGHELRGLPVRAEAMDMIFTPAALTTSLIVMLAFFVLIGVVAYRNRTYFSAAKSDAA